MTPTRLALNEVFSAKITIIIYKRVFRVAVNTYVPIFRGLDARGGRKLRTDTHTRAHTHTHTHTHGTRHTHTHTHTHTCGTTTVYNDNNTL